MLNLRRPRTSLSSNSYYSSRKKKNNLPKPVLLAAIPATFLLAELGLRVFAGVTGQSAELDAYVGEPAIVNAYQLKPLSESGKPIQGMPGQGKLAVVDSPLTGYRLLPNQTNKMLQINGQGFRATQDLTLEKPQNEVRIFVLGGSTAFGKMVSSNATTFTQQLETRLNQQVQNQKQNLKQFRPDVLPYFADELEKALRLPPKIRDAQYRVINAAVPGYSSGNSLSQLTAQILQYQPDMIVLVNGYDDLLLPSDQEAGSLGISNAIAENATGRFVSHLTGGIQRFFWNFYLIKSIPYWITKPEPTVEAIVDHHNHSNQALRDRIPEDKELERRVKQYQQNLQKVARISQAAKIPLLVSLQPELSQRSNLSENEKRILQSLGDQYKQRIQTAYQTMSKALESLKKSSPGLLIVKLTDSYNKLPGDAFQDTIHLTDEAQQVMGDRLYEVIAPRLQVQPKPFNGNAPV
ncbi:MAG: SGNH/GDSL hydrolase family protein [Synechococcales bacterium]|nr:SGNH/GDSL hydrolase family protein [Synechococcales bacterium]